MLYHKMQSHTIGAIKLWRQSEIDNHFIMQYFD